LRSASSSLRPSGPRRAAGTLPLVDGLERERPFDRERAHHRAELSILPLELALAGAPTVAPCQALLHGDQRVLAPSFDGAREHTVLPSYLVDAGLAGQHREHRFAPL